MCSAEATLQTSTISSWTRGPAYATRQHCHGASLGAELKKRYNYTNSAGQETSVNTGQMKKRAIDRRRSYTVWNKHGVEDNGPTTAVRGKTKCTMEAKDLQAKKSSVRKLPCCSQMKHTWVEASHGNTEKGSPLRDVSQVSSTAMRVYTITCAIAG